MALRRRSNLGWSSAVDDRHNSHDMLVKLTNVSVAVDGKTLLANVDLGVRAGERIVVLGPNGAGKTTLLKLCNGIVKATQGSVQTLPVRDQALIFQRPPLLARSVLDNVRFVLGAVGVAEPERTTRARTALTECNLDAMATQQARLLSGGEQQRLALARAWACKPRLLLADEPTANLAPAATREVERLIHAVVALGTTLLLTTHNVAQAKRLATRIVFLDSGRVVEDRPAVDFFASPQSATARNYLEGESL
jgi:tungstate transport system ATP-binding protein